MTKQDELDLILAAASGDETAQLQVLHKYDRLIWKLVRHFHYDMQIDLHSACQVRILECLHEFNPERGAKFITFIYHELRAVTKWHSNRRKWHSGIAVDDVLEKRKAVYNPYDEHDMKDALKVLPDLHKRIIQLLYYEDMTLREAGARLGIDKSMVHRKQREALSMLRMVL